MPVGGKALPSTWKGPAMLMSEIYRVFPEEKEAIHRGPAQAGCGRRDLQQTMKRVAEIAANVPGCLSWNIEPHIGIGTSDPHVYVEFFNFHAGLHTFKDIVGMKRLYWWYHIPPPKWWDPDQGVRDPSQGENWNPEYQ